MAEDPEIAIRARGLGKRYRLGSSGFGLTTLRDTIAATASTVLRRSSAAGGDASARRSSDTFWALQDVDVEIRRGEVVGIIGPNGAGKTTLLKILSRITEPTVGSVELVGRVGSLLEVGTGFHPELTGRENILLNGAILGMSRAEIQRKFAAIVGFAEIGRFLDTPVKRYSSGMYVRLAFAVAAHLEPEILLVDEVLAVGDIEFQRRCLGKMDEVARGGRTVLFVSHNMAAVENLCGRGLLIEHGRLVVDGPVSKVIEEYIGRQEDRLRGGLTGETRRTGSGGVIFKSFSLEGTDRRPLPMARSGQDVVLVFTVHNGTGRPQEHVDVGFSLFTSNGQPLTVLYASYTGKLLTVDIGTVEIRCRIERLPLAPGRYRVGGRVVVAGVEADYPTDGLGLLEVEGGDFYGTGHAGFEGPTPVLVDGSWE